MRGSPRAPRGAASAEQFNRGDKYRFPMVAHSGMWPPDSPPQRKQTRIRNIAGESQKLVAQKDLETYPRLRDFASFGGDLFPYEWGPYITTHPKSYIGRARINQIRSVSSPGPDEGRAVTLHTAPEYDEANMSGVGNIPLVRYMRGGIRTAH